ncbi:MAG: DUF1987 domain-containing protein [Cytophagaceae bacterium]|jgi:hypothetical protein|nr:DUF1987 domain-containing protein [Cytophagaceae bacterium]
MQALHIEATEDSPLIWFEESTGIVKISGRSIPENATEFYAPLLQWIEQLAVQPAAVAIRFIFQLEYLNTASYKVFQDILGAIDRLPQASIRWEYESSDIGTEEMIRDFAECIKTPIEAVKY